MIQDIQAAEAINTFPIGEEQIFVLTSSQLRAIISQAVQEAIQPLKDRLSRLEGITARLENKTLDLAATQDVQGENQVIQAGHIKVLKEKAAPPIQPLQASRLDTLRRILAGSGGKMLAAQARKLMELPKNRFSELLKTAGKYLEIKPYVIPGRKTDRRKKILILRSEAR